MGFSDLYTIVIMSNQIKSLLLSHHHSTCALVSEILEIVLQTVQKQFTYRQYILTQKTMCRMHIHIVSTHSVLLDILAVINTHYTQNVHILHYVHLYTQWYAKKKKKGAADLHRPDTQCHGCALHGILW